MKCSTADIAIQLTNVTKQYTIHHEKPTLVERVGIIASMSYPFQKRIIEKLSRYDYTHCI